MYLGHVVHHVTLCFAVVLLSMLSLKEKDRPVVRKLLCAGCCVRCVLRFCCVGSSSAYRRSYQVSHIQPLPENQLASPDVGASLCMCTVCLALMSIPVCRTYTRSFSPSSVRKTAPLVRSKQTSRRINAWEWKRIVLHQRRRRRTQTFVPSVWESCRTSVIRLSPNRYVFLL